MSISLIDTGPAGPRPPLTVALLIFAASRRGWEHRRCPVGRGGGDHATPFPTQQRVRRQGRAVCFACAITSLTRAQHRNW